MHICKVRAAAAWPGDTFDLLRNFTNLPKLQGLSKEKFKKTVLSMSSANAHVEVCRRKHHLISKPRLECQSQYAYTLGETQRNVIGVSCVVIEERLRLSRHVLIKPWKGL